MAVSLPRTAGSRDAVTASFAEYDPLREPAMRPSPFQAFVRIMMGCDKFCTYCIVPSVRGPEQSRPPDAIVDEARMLADQGVKEITLLGQTVNSYKFAEPDGRTARLSDLLERLHDDRGRRADQVHHQLPQRHDRRPAPGRPRPAQGLALPPRPRPERAATRS